MTWGELRAKIEEAGIKSDQKIAYVEVQDMLGKDFEVKVYDCGNYSIGIEVEAAK